MEEISVLFHALGCTLAALLHKQEINFTVLHTSLKYAGYWLTAVSLSQLTQLLKPVSGHSDSIFQTNNFSQLCHMFQIQPGQNLIHRHFQTPSQSYISSLIR